MKKWPVPAVVFRSLIVCLGLVAVATAQTNSTTAAADATAPDDIDWSRHVVEAYRDFTNQQKLTFDMLGKARADAAEAAATAKENAARSAAQLKRLELTWAAQHERDMAAVQEAHQFAVKVIGAFAALGLLGLVLLGFVLSRAMNRRLEVVTTALASHAADALPAGETGLLPLNAVAQSNARFVNAIERLEQRITEMEQEAGGATLDLDQPPAVTTAESGPAETDPAALEAGTLLGKAQVHLNLDQHQEALDCVEKALALAFDNAEAHVKKGSALEGLDRVDEALAEYDKAIALDHSLTMAYLRKGGVFNRLERYGEALQCYELALKTQQKSFAVTQLEA